MIVAVSRITLPKTERYLYWVRVAIKRGHPSGCPLFIGASSICFANRPPATGFIEKQGNPG